MMLKDKNAVIYGAGGAPTTSASTSCRVRSGQGIRDFRYVP
jgi:hypothetical protein